MTEYVDRRGKTIDAGMWNILRAAPDYEMVRFYAKKSNAPGDPVTASVRWIGVSSTPFVLYRSNEPDTICDDELSAVSQFEDFLVSKDCGAWYPAGGSSNYGKTYASGKMHFHPIDGVTKHNEMSESMLADIVENPEYGSW